MGVGKPKTRKAAPGAACWPGLRPQRSQGLVRAKEEAWEAQAEFRTNTFVPATDREPLQDGGAMGSGCLH